MCNYGGLHIDAHILSMHDSDCLGPGTKPYKISEWGVMSCAHQKTEIDQSGAFLWPILLSVYLQSSTLSLHIHKLIN